jgi:hypothetical protein
MKIYIINIDNDAQNITNTLNNIGISNFELVDLYQVVNVNEFFESQNKEVFNKYYDRDISYSELNNVITHQNIYKKIIDNNENAIILENNIEFLNNNILDEVAHASIPFDFNVIFLNDMVNNNDWYRSPLITADSKFINNHKCIKIKLWNNLYGSVVFNQIHWWRAYSYIISPQGAKKALESNYPVSNVVDGWFHLNIGDSVYKFETPLFSQH